MGIGSYLGKAASAAGKALKTATKQTAKVVHSTLKKAAPHLKAGLHAAASLIHHYLWHDNVLRRMLPSSN